MAKKCIDSYNNIWNDWPWVLTESFEVCIGLELMDSAPLGVHGETYDDKISGQL